VLAGRSGVWGAGVGVVSAADSSALMAELRIGGPWRLAATIRLGTRHADASAGLDGRGLYAGTRAIGAEA
jgi:hypothetical protein